MNDFTFQYALRLPNGSLYLKPTQRAMFASMFGPVGDPPRELAVFDQRSDAEEVLDEMRKLAREVGVDNLGATIVTRLCSPFVGEHEDGTEFVKAVTEWIEGHRG
jgi:hypothetical protein